MSDIPSSAEYVRDRLAEYLDGVGWSVETTEHGAQLTAEGGPQCQSITLEVTQRGLLDIDDGAILTFPGFDLAEVTRDVARRDALLKLTERYDGCAGDVEPYALGEVVTSRFAVVLLGGADYGASAVADTLEAAQADALRDVGDSMCADYPFLIVDLDTGKTWEPVWSSLVWTSSVAHIVPGTTRRV